MESAPTSPLFWGEGRARDIWPWAGQELLHTDHILAFKNAYREERSIATVDRVLSTLRTAINWGRAQVPPLIGGSPFHRFGVTIKVKEEPKRDRRVSRKEEQSLLSACQKMVGAEHKFVGASMHDRIIGAIETSVARASCFAFRTDT